MSRRPPRGFFEGGESPFGRLPTEPSFPTIRVSSRAVFWIILAAVLLLLLFGQIASGQWQTILTFLNEKPFNVQDPIWHQDVSFYVFTLPFYRFVWGWLLGVVILMMLVAVGLYASRAGLQNFILPARA